MKHYNIRVYGKVQGVFFRASARHHAEMLDISGFAQNEDDGSVYIEAEGSEENLKLFLDWCNKGSEGSEVTKVETEEGAIKKFTSFGVNRRIH